MSRYFPHTPYAEDQPLSHVILTTHVLTRAVTTGSIIGLVLTSVRQSIPSLRRPGPLSEKLLLSATRSTIITTAIVGVGLTARMWGREPIEWQDRSWRLLENRGQLETDDWTYGGMGGALLATGLMGVRGAGGPAKLGWRGVAGAAGIGSVGGMIGYMAWRYGINGCKFVEKDKKGERKGI
ncbi:hypothetical protein A0O28_0044780 [Trichoderma guizhouense]|uniref:Uncharacterized protein n=1 Tax=Trichoderma guizhouense TaxID=1491466 RepID=A0A1T3C8X2_9HYPO|nr:hypothetical protein A0O28_0044780 [Trichoderma guizhouense]